jgi:hypothetical protein
LFEAECTVAFTSPPPGVHLFIIRLFAAGWQKCKMVSTQG